MHEIHIPKYGMSTIEVDIEDVYVSVGDVLAVGDPVAEIETEKVVNTLESEVAGTVASVHVAAGETYEVGDLVCVVELS